MQRAVDRLVLLNDPDDPLSPAFDAREGQTRLDGLMTEVEQRLAAIESELAGIRETVDRFVSATPAVEDQDGDVW